MQISCLFLLVYFNKVQDLSLPLCANLDLCLFVESRNNTVIEPLLLGIVLGLIPITLAGLFVAAYLQYKRGNQLNLD